MNDPIYDIYFRGGIHSNTDLATVKANMAKLFKVNDARIETMFSGKACVLKKDLNKTKALQYQQAIEKTGARVFLKEQSQTQPPATPPPTAKTVPSAPSTSQSTSPQEQEKTKSSWDLSPTGSDLLKADERKAEVTTNIDTSAIQLVSPFAEPEPENKTTPPPPNTDHMSVADVGSDILVEKPPEPTAPDIDLSEMAVAPLGSNMSDND
ncbi:hypothetical protein A9Q99_06110 [Gammaproteobacteria bacterium 45_16_T64]|nr:hypothetical protein A9Q99_06110 [Gammaproteobacteria bacterium 45_16_T64]